MDLDASIEEIDKYDKKQKQDNHKNENHKLKGKNKVTENSERVEPQLKNLKRMRKNLINSDQRVSYINFLGFLKNYKIILKIINFY